jgi:hypothetical protein
MITTIALEDKDKRQFDLLLSEHAIKNNRNYTQAEFFRLLMERWKVKP